MLKIEFITGTILFHTNYETLAYLLSSMIPGSRSTRLLHNTSIDIFCLQLLELYFISRNSFSLLSCNNFLFQISFVPLNAYSHMTDLRTYPSDK